MEKKNVYGMYVEFTNAELYNEKCKQKISGWIRGNNDW